MNEEDPPDESPADKERKPIRGVIPGGKRTGSLGHEPALQTLGCAAAAVGLTTEELINLVADSGALALPPTDHATEIVTLDELGSHLRTQLSQTPPADRVDWFRNLSAVQRGAVVVSLRNNGASNHACAVAFGVPADHVQALFNEYCDKVGQNVTNVRLTTIVGHMQLVAERAQAGAVEKKDWATFWRIQKELIANLQALGVVDRAAHKIEMTHKMEERTAKHIDDLAELRIKQRRREEEIKLIAAEVTDAEPIPEDLEFEDD